jgi:hypothetical protein
MSPGPLSEALSQIDCTDDHDVEEVRRPPATRKGKEKSVRGGGGEGVGFFQGRRCSNLLCVSKY